MTTAAMTQAQILEKMARAAAIVGKTLDTRQDPNSDRTQFRVVAEGE